MSPLRRLLWSFFLAALFCAYSACTSASRGASDARVFRNPEPFPVPPESPEPFPPDVTPPVPDPVRDAQGLRCSISVDYARNAYAGVRTRYEFVVDAGETEIFEITGVDGGSDFLVTQIVGHRIIATPLEFGMLRLQAQISDGERSGSCSVNVGVVSSFFGIDLFGPPIGPDSGTWPGEPGGIGTMPVAAVPQSFEEVLVTDLMAQLGASACSDPTSLARMAALAGMYVGVLGRPAALEELRAALGLANRSGMRAVAEGIVRSEENYRNVVSQLYETLLGRNGADAEVAGHVAELRQRRATIAQVLVAFLASEEFLRMRGHSSHDAARPAHAHGPSASELAVSYYEHVLDRLPEAGALSQWAAAYPNVAAIDRRRDMARGFVYGIENRTNLVLGLYKGLLGRNPAESELSAWANAIREGGQSFEQAQIAFLSSSEFFQKYASAVQRLCQ